MHVGRVYSRKRWFPMEALNKLIPLMSFDTAQESVRQACPAFIEGRTTNGINHFVRPERVEGRTCSRLPYLQLCDMCRLSQMKVLPPCLLEAAA